MPCTASSASTMADDLVAVLRDLAEEVRLLRGAVERLAPAEVNGLGPVDRRRLERLLPVLVAQFGEAFSVWELYDVAGSEGIAANDMRIALGDLSAPRLGKLLRRAHDSGVAVAGFRVVRAGADRGVALWGLTAAPPPFPKDVRPAKLVLA